MSPPTGLAKSLALANQTALSMASRVVNPQELLSFRCGDLTNLFRGRMMLSTSKPRTCPKDFTGFKKLLILGTLKPKTDTRTS